MIDFKETFKEEDIPIDDLRIVIDCLDIIEDAVSQSVLEYIGEETEFTQDQMDQIEIIFSVQEDRIEKGKIGFITDLSVSMLEENGIETQSLSSPTKTYVNTAEELFNHINEKIEPLQKQACFVLTASDDEWATIQ